MSILFTWKGKKKIMHLYSIVRKIEILLVACYWCWAHKPYKRRTKKQLNWNSWKRSLGWSPAQLLILISSESSSNVKKVKGLCHLMLYLLKSLGNENEIHAYLVKCNLRMRIKCVSPTHFGNKKWESHSHGGLGMRISINWTDFCNLLIFSYFPNYPNSNDN